MLGAETKSFRSYGKRKTNTTNKPRAWNFDSPDRPAVALPSPESNDDDDTDDDGDKWSPPIRPPPPSRSKALALIKAKRRQLPHPSKSPNKRRLDPDKENEDSAGSTVEAPRRPFFKPKNRLVVQSPASVASKRAARGRGSGSGKSSPASDVESSVEEVRKPSPLKPKAAGKRAVPVAPLSSCHRLDEDTTDGGMPSPPPTRPTRRTRASHVAPVIVVDLTLSDDESEVAASPVLASEPLSLRPLSPSPLPTAPLPTPHTFPETLRPLLSLTLSPTPFDFTSFVENPPTPFASRAGGAWRKIGEASFSEVFASIGEDGEELVIKIIPISAQVDGAAVGESGEEEDAVPFMSEWRSVLREIQISELVGGNRKPMDGFVKFRGAFIVLGAYPASLLAQWDLFKKAQYPPCDDQIRPDLLPATQAYAIICLVHGGSDLENFKLKSWVDASSILWQVAMTCAEAEEMIRFEHRDLHWGNVLVESLEADSTASLTSSMATLRIGSSQSSTSRASRSPSREVKVTLIDFTLSRVQERGAPAVYDSFDDECVFEGSGDQQFDIYRAMKAHIKSDWAGYYPLTNLLWLHYLVNKLLFAKSLKPPPANRASAPPSPLPPTPRRTATRARTLPLAPARRQLLASDPNERAAYAELVAAERLLREVVEGAVEEKGKKAVKGKGKGRRGKEVMAEERMGWTSAGDFVAWWSAERLN